MNVNSRGHKLYTRFDQYFSIIKLPPGPKNPVGGIKLHSLLLLVLLLCDANLHRSRIYRRGQNYGNVNRQ